MGNLCISMHFTAHCIPCIAFSLVTHACTFAIDHVEQGPRQAPVHLTPFLEFIFVILLSQLCFLDVH
jgi:hypothetical protein